MVLDHHTLLGQRCRGKPGLCLRWVVYCGQIKFSGIRAHFLVYDREVGRFITTVVPHAVQYVVYSLAVYDVGGAMIVSTHVVGIILL